MQVPDLVSDAKKPHYSANRYILQVVCDLFEIKQCSNNQRWGANEERGSVFVFIGKKLNKAEIERRLQKTVETID